MRVGKVLPDEIRGSLQRILIRLELGKFLNSGPRANIISVESLVAYSTAVNELHREGYQMVPAEAYAAAYGISLASVYQKIHLDGSLFALVYPEGEPPLEAVPLEEKEAKDGLGPQLPWQEES